MPDISNRDDTIDSRDVLERIEELEEERQPLLDALEEAEAGDDAGAADAAQNALAEYDSSGDGAELAALKALAEEAEGYADDWRHGATLIRDSHFPEYAREFAEEIGAIDRNAKWPLAHIDWESAAEELKQDYTCVTFDGVDYWVR